MKVDPGLAVTLTDPEFIEQVALYGVIIIVSVAVFLYFAGKE